MKSNLILKNPVGDGSIHNECHGSSAPHDASPVADGIFPCFAWHACGEEVFKHGEVLKYVVICSGDFWTHDFACTRATRVRDTIFVSPPEEVAPPPLSPVRGSKRPRGGEAML